MNSNPDLDILFDSPGLFAASTRRGATSEMSNPYSGFSVCSYTGDNENHYNKCRAELAEYLDITPDKIVMPLQTHSSNAMVVTDIDADLNNTDALITTAKGITIGVNTADCVPLVLADENAGIIAAIHAGWRGALAGIALKTAEKMIELGAVPSNIKGAIGACICGGCFEVGEEVAELFPEEFVIRRKGIKPHIDLPGYVASTLVNAGINIRNIKEAAGCTKCHPDHYFSARASGIKSGRNFTFIMLRDTSSI